MFGNRENLESRRQNSFSCSKKRSGSGGEENGRRILGSLTFCYVWYEMLEFEFVTVGYK
jgi:hypothetical protein